MKKSLISLLFLIPSIVQGAQNDPHNPCSIIHQSTESPKKLSFDEMLTITENNVQLRIQSLQQIEDLKKKLNEQDENIRAQIKSCIPLYPLLALVAESKITIEKYNETIVHAIEILQKTQTELSSFLSLLNKKNPDESETNKIKFLIKAQDNIQKDLIDCTQLHEQAHRAVTNITTTQSSIETTIKTREHDAREHDAYVKKTLKNIMYLFIITLIVIYIYKKYNGKIDFYFKDYLNSNTPFFNTFT
jgi:hypothetical protein